MNEPFVFSRMFSYLNLSIPIHVSNANEEYTTMYHNNTISEKHEIIFAMSSLELKVSAAQSTDKPFRHRLYGLSGRVQKDDIRIEALVRGLIIAGLGADSP